VYEIVRGPLVWVAFSVFLIGSLWRLVSMALLARKDKVVYSTYSLRYGLRSLLRWSLPFGTRSMRLHPFHTAVSFGFHICLLATPLLVRGHAVSWEQSWGVSWWSLPSTAADAMALVVVFGGLFFGMRRLLSPVVRNVTSAWDHLLVLLVISPFLTGFAAKHQWLDAETATVLHIACGAAWLMAIPFTRLSHMLWFVFTRGYMGSDQGALRHARDW